MAKSRPIPAVFLDRDGTIIEDRGHLRSPSEVVFFRNSIRALRVLQRTFRLFIVTNQPGIAEGILGSAEVTQFIIAMTGPDALTGIGKSRAERHVK